MLLAKDAQTVQFFGLPQHNNRVFLGTTSFTYDDSPYTTKARINGCFYHLFKDEEVDDDTFPFPLGERFKAADIANVLTLGKIYWISYFTKSISYRIARIPIALPIPFDQKYIKIGEANQDFKDFLENMSTDKDKAPLMWHKAVSEFNAVQHKVIADPGSEEELKDKLPKGSDDSPVDVSTTPYVSLAGLPSDEDVEENKQLIDALNKRLDTLRDENDENIFSKTTADRRDELAPLLGGEEKEGDDDDVLEGSATNDDNGGGGGGGSSYSLGGSEKILKILNLSKETDEHLKDKYPTIKMLQEEFFLRTTDEFKNMTKTNESGHKEPLFKRSDVEEFIILCRWIEENREKSVDVDWEKFTKRSFNKFRKEAPKEHLGEIFEELGIDKATVKTLKDKVQTPAQLVQKPRSLYKDEVKGGDLGPIKEFKKWYSFHSIGFLPSDWIISFREFNDIHQKERDLRKVLSQGVGLTHDAIRTLKMNDISDVTALIEKTEKWRIGDKGDVSCVNKMLCCLGGNDEDDPESKMKEWEEMGLTRNYAIDIINFRHWYIFYVDRKPDMKG